MSEKLTDVEKTWLQKNMTAISFLSKLDANEVKLLAEKATSAVLTGAQPVIREGKKGRAFFMIYHGKVLVYVMRNEQKVQLALLGPGQYFGEISLLSNQPTTADVVAVGPSKVFYIDPETFINMVRKNKNLALYIIDVMKKRLRERKKEVEELMKPKNIDDINAAIKDFLSGGEK